MEISKIISDCRSDLSQLSIKTYTSNIVKALQITKAKTIDLLFNDPKKLIDTIDKNYDNNNSKKTKLASIIVFLKCYQDKTNKKKIDESINTYNDAIDGYSNAIKKELSTNEKSGSDKDNWTTAEDIQTIKDNLKKEVPKKINTIYDLNKYRNYVMFLLYDALPTRADVADSKLVLKTKQNLSDEYNYIVLDKKNKTIEYVLNVYKTKGTYGPKTIQLDNDLYSVLLDYKKNLDNFTNENWLFLNDECKKLSRNRMGVIYSSLGSSIGKKLSITLNRHIKVSELIPIEKIKELADKMGHSPDEAMKVYAKKD
jgi:hypothetical protein